MSECCSLCRPFRVCVFCSLYRSFWGLLQWSVTQKLLRFQASLRIEGISAPLNDLNTTLMQAAR